MTIMVYDLETVPDIESGRRLLQLPESRDSEVLEALLARRRAQSNGSEFLPLYLQRIVAISVVVKDKDWVKVWSLGETDSSEAELIERFFAGLSRYTPTLVSWNGSGFDLPVLHYRSLLHGVAAPKYWDMGESNSEFKWNNYLNRYHHRHLDLMDVLSAYQSRAVAPLHEIAILLKFPGKLGLNGGEVLERFQANRLGDIRDYCESDVLNTYLIYLRFEQIRGRLSSEEYQAECHLLSEMLAASSKQHHHDFLEAWQTA
jgi:predicted PolB exonuclease-like 3'-5' exonuclease